MQVLIITLNCHLYGKNKYSVAVALCMSDNKTMPKYCIILRFLPGIIDHNTMDEVHLVSFFENENAMVYFDTMSMC